MLWRMMVIANNAKDLYGALLVTGIMSHIAIQVVLNIAVVTNTGVSIFDGKEKGKTKRSISSEWK